MRPYKIKCHLNAKTEKNYILTRESVLSKKENMAQWRSDTKTLLPHNKTIYEVFSLSDRLTTSGSMTDAFGRLRTSTALTLFDSQHRYRENDDFNTHIVATGSTEYVQAESTVNLKVTANSGDACFRESRKVFPYQPGKSLLILNTFVMEPPKSGLIQRVGYFSANNGVFLESNGTSNIISFVLRSNATGNTVETRVSQTEWNTDKFLGDSNSYSFQMSTDIDRGALNIANTNILWFDVEWLGTGDVRCGFVVDGVMSPAHIFHNDNKRKAVYMSTATLPIRYEIFNELATANSSTLKQICTSVISEGGYQIAGRQRTAGQLPNNAVTLTNTGTIYPVVSIRLKAENPDSVVIPRAISLLVLGKNGSHVQWRLVEGANISGGLWQSIGANSSVQYNANATSMTDGTVLKSGFTYYTNQATLPIKYDSDLFRDQLKRNTFNGTNVTFTLAATGSASGDTVIGSLDWEEVI